MSAGERSSTALDPADAARVRDGVADAVLSGPEGLRDALAQGGDAWLPLVAASRVGADEGARLLDEAIAGARRGGHSWGAIGRTLGVSRQAAQQRFGGAAPLAPAPSDTRRVLAPLTALDELPALERAGREGWRLVDSGAGFHVVERSDRAWEHRRVPFAVGGRLRRLEAAGWEPVSSWFPWRYLRRPLS